MLNIPQLAQSAPPALNILSLLLVMTVLAGAIVSANLIVRRRWYTLPPLPDGTGEPPMPLLAFILALAVTLFIAVLGIIASLRGLDDKALKTPAGMREMAIFTPVSQLLTAAAVLALLWPYLPQALHWTHQRSAYARQAAAGYLLALPWVLVSGAIVQLIVYAFALESKKQHLLFEIWVGDHSGVTLFKVMAIFSAVVAAPLVEELVFRGVLQRLVQRATGNATLAIIVTSLAFMSTHSPWTTQPSIFLLSLFIGWLYFRSGTILAPILMHALFNAMQFVLFLSFSGGVPAPAS